MCTVARVRVFLVIRNREKDNLPSPRQLLNHVHLVVKMGKRISMCLECVFQISLILSVPHNKRDTFWGASDKALSFPSHRINNYKH